MTRHFPLAIFACLLLAKAHDAAEPSYSQDVQPILSEHCYQCHGPDESSRQADLRLDQREDLLRAVGVPEAEENQNEPTVRSIPISDSELLRRLVTTDRDELMPPPSAKHPLSPEQIETVKAWIENGASWEGHWAFIPPTRPSVPPLNTAEPNSTSSLATEPLQPRNAIDHFILQTLKSMKPQGSEQLTPNPPATPEKWLRRVTLDLTGLPPTLEELDAFLAQIERIADRAQAEQEVIERLLASPRFGERMAMPWLDAARYADTNGYQGDRERTMWPWRDWVVDAINRNVPYDDFTVWQIAGDLLPNATEEQRLATGFCRNHMINGEGGRIAEENRVEYIFDQIETVSTIWLGMTMQCCRCHDHKFDPLTQRDYFQLFAYFNQTPINGGGGDPQMAPNMTYVPAWQRDQQQRYEAAVNAALEQLATAEKTLQSDATGECQLPVEVVTVISTSADQRSKEHWKALVDYAQSHQGDLQAKIQGYQSAKKRRDDFRRRLPKVMVMADRDKLRETFVLDKGLYNERKDVVSAATPGFLPAAQDVSGNRLALAEWLVSKDHPLTARVTVNRIWQMFFARGLVKTSEDFGVQGEKPSHPELLDWLAVEFVESGWDVKHLVRMIVSSATYGQSENASTSQLENDPENRWLSRASRRRMPAWMIRDHALFQSGVGVLDLGGEGVKPYQPDGIWAEASFGKKRYEQSLGSSLYRRSLYIYWRRIVGPTMFFDMARRQTCSVRTTPTNTPLHALVTFNDVSYVEAARLLAERVLRSSAGPSAQIATAFRLATSRRPTNTESDLLLTRLNAIRQHFRASPSQAQELLAVGASEFDEHHDATELASHTSLCLMLLNLDEALHR